MYNNRARSILKFGDSRIGLGSSLICYCSTEYHVFSI